MKKIKIFVQDILSIKPIKIKLSQGVKPFKGGVLLDAKITKELT